MIVPFVPFSEAEAAVVAHKYILELAARVRGPVDLSGKVIIGNVDLKVVDDGNVCSYLSKEGYDPRFGARSLQGMVDACVEVEVHRQYLDIDEEIVERSNDEPNAKATIKLASSSEAGGEIIVSLK